MEDNVAQTAQASLLKKNGRPTKALPATSAQIRIPTQRPVSQSDHHIKRKTEHVTKEWTAEVAHTDKLSPQLPLATDTQPALAPKRIQRLHQKITIALLKKMAELHSTARTQVDCKVAAKSSPQHHHDQDELWRDMMKPHEERHFQIGRITNYFS
jgi:hypothetical protein